MRDDWRLLVTEPLDGASNMAMDEALLRSRVRGSGTPTVRLYGWSPPTVSLGYAQAWDEAIDRAACARLGIGAVRRPTGGSAILHGGPTHEVTYAVVAGAADFAGADDVLETYRVIGRGLLAGLAQLGVAAELAPIVRRRGADPASPAFCFARTGAYEIAAGGRKLVGSAQRRQRGAFLQHGTIVLQADPVSLRAVFPREPDPLVSMTSLAERLGHAPAFDEVVTAVAAGLGPALGATLAPAGLSADEVALMETLVAEKYGTSAWTEDGRLPAGGPAPAVPSAARG